MIKNYYEVLEIKQDASIIEIKKAYRRQAVKYHPDKNFGNEFLTQRFLDAKEAYDILVDTEKRIEYDFLYVEFFKKNTNPASQSENSSKQDLNQDNYNIKEHFSRRTKSRHIYFSKEVRNEIHTPQERPDFDMWGNSLDSDVVFFTYPKKIGFVIGAYSDLRKDSSILSPRKSKSFWNKLGFSSRTEMYASIFVGVNGYAFYSCKGTVENIVDSEENTFSESTDLVIFTTDNYLNHVYIDTHYGVFLGNHNDDSVQFVYSFDYKKKKADSNLSLQVCTLIEQYWTVYLLDRLEDMLEKNGYISFNVHGEDAVTEYLQLGIGYIRFINKEKGNFTYNFNDIERVYSKGNKLYIRHHNYKKSFLFFRSGNEDEIPLASLANRRFFFRVLELFLGYKV